MNNIDALFDRMDAWRHLPNYQLERRADIFFSLYLSEVLQEKLGFPVKNELIPEFPVHIETIYGIKTDKSYKIDYIAFSEKLDKAIFVELKTDDSSLRTKQDKYLQAASDVGMSKLIEGLKKIFQATNSKQKYYCLFEEGYRSQYDVLPFPHMDVCEQLRAPVMCVHLSGHIFFHRHR